MLNDPVNPQHYRQGGIECIQAIEAALTPEELNGFLKGQVFKYLWRFGRKDDPLQEVRKAKWYLDRLESNLSPKITDKCPPPPRKTATEAANKFAEWAALQNIQRIWDKAKTMGIGFDEDKLNELQAEIDRENFQQAMDCRENPAINEILFLPVEPTWLLDMVGWDGCGWYYTDYSQKAFNTCHGPFETRAEAVHNLAGYKTSSCLKN